MLCLCYLKHGSAMNINHDLTFDDVDDLIRRSIPDFSDLDLNEKGEPVFRLLMSKECTDTIRRIMARGKYRKPSYRGPLRHG